jgi:hypothetical protein
MPLPRHQPVMMYRIMEVELHPFLACILGGQVHVLVALFLRRELRSLIEVQCA